jgi:hypothetical protein
MQATMTIFDIARLKVQQQLKVYKQNSPGNLNLVDRR